MKIYINMKRIVILVCILCLGFLSMFAQAFAYSKIDVDRQSSIDIYFGENETGFSGVEFSAYKVAEILDDGSYKLTDDFKNYPINLNNMNSSGWRALAQTLSAYVSRDKIKPLQKKETGVDGHLVFSNLSTGLYLVIGTQYMNGESIYNPESMLISAPSMTEENEYIYDVSVSCKFDYDNAPLEYIDIKVQKVWKDDGNENKRPDNITVQLIENGNIVDTVTLGRENNWEHTWESLNGKSVWQITESNVPENYTVTVTKEGSVYIFTNTYSQKTPDKLPQTGMLWWPVPILAFSGILLLTVGLILRRLCDNSDEK